MGAQEQQEWIISMEKKLKKAQEYASDQPWEKWSIYRVPRRLKNAQDTKVYTPQTVSIGPYHHTDEQVQSMDRHKWVALYRTLERSGHDLNVFLDAIRAVEEEARACFQPDIAGFSSNEFVEMMVVDGCFIVEVLLCSPRVENFHDLVTVIHNRMMVDDVLLDMVMLENQIPIFVLDKLLEIMYVNVGNYSSSDNNNNQVVALALNLFNPEWLTGTPMSETELKELKSSVRNRQCLHILDVFRQSLLHQPRPQQNPSFQYKSQWRICEQILPGCLRKRYNSKSAMNSERKQRCARTQVIHRVTELRESGVKFRKRNTNHFWDIKFENGVLEIPSIWVQDGTMSILLNLAAFEYCHLKITDAVIASYAIFMECLIKSPEDVNYLHRKGIIQHLLGDDAEVVDMFKSVSKEMLADARNNRYAELAEQVNGYCNRRRNRWRASLVQKYFSNPWAVVSLVAAFVLLLLTAAQTFYAVFSYYSPNSVKNNGN